MNEATREAPGTQRGALLLWETTASGWRVWNQAGSRCGVEGNMWRWALDAGTGPSLLTPWSYLDMTSAGGSEVGIGFIMNAGV